MGYLSLAQADHRDLTGAREVSRRAETLLRGLEDSAGLALLLAQRAVFESTRGDSTLAIEALTDAEHSPSSVNPLPGAETAYSRPSPGMLSRHGVDSTRRLIPG